MVGRNVRETRGADRLDLLAPSRSRLDLFDYEGTRAYLSSERPEIVIHAAGRVGGIEANRLANGTFLAENLLMGLNLLQACAELGIPRVINLGSSCMYPRDIDEPLTEEMILTAPLEPTNEGYGLAKISVAKLAEFISLERPELSYKTVIPSNLYGPWDHFDSGRSHLVPGAIRKIHDAVTSGGRTVEIWGDGTARREFLFAPDLAAFLVDAVDRFNELPSPLNVGLGVDYSVLEYYQLIAEILGFDGEFVFNRDRPVGMKRKLLDSSRARAWGWAPRHSLSQGLRLTCDFYRSRVAA
jgi:nucleoside-diphosphate-sugar epimerase